MRKLSTLAAFTAALFASAAVVQADNPKWASVPGWNIHVDPTTKGCFAIGQYPEGSIIRLGFDRSQAKYYLYFANTNWTTIKEGSNYDLRFVFDDSDSFTARLRAENMGGTLVLVHNNISADFMVDFMAKFNLKIFAQNGKQIANLNLVNTFAAYSEVINCQKATDIMSSIDTKPKAPLKPGQAEASGHYREDARPTPPPAATNNTGPWIIALSQGDGGSHTTTGKLDGTVPVTWTVDTGASITSIPLEMAELLDATEVRKMRFQMADGRVRTESVILVKKLSVGGVVVSSNVEVAVGERGSAPLLGKNWLDRFASFEVDNKSGNLTVRK